MVDEHRRVAATSPAHARALAENMTARGFEVEHEGGDLWVLRKRRRRGDEVVTIAVADTGSTVPPPPIPGGGWAPPSGPRYG